MDVDGRDVIPSDDPAMNPKTNAVKSNRWTNEELLLAVQGVRQYGLDFKVHCVYRILLLLSWAWSRGIAFLKKKAPVCK